MAKDPNPTMERWQNSPDKDNRVKQPMRNKLDPLNPKDGGAKLENHTSPHPHFHHSRFDGKARVNRSNPHEDNMSSGAFYPNAPKPDPDKGLLDQYLRKKLEEQLADQKPSDESMEKESTYDRIDTLNERAEELYAQYERFLEEGLTEPACCALRAYSASIEQATLLLKLIDR